MSGFVVVPVELQSARVLVDRVAVEGRAELARLVVAGQGLLDGGWHGQAGAAFAAGWQEWVTGARSVLAALAELGDALGVAGRNYEITDDAVGAEVARAVS